MAITKDLLSKSYEISSNKGSLIPGKNASAKKTAATRINPPKSSHTELQKHMVALSNIAGTIDDTNGLYIGDNIKPVNIENLPTVINRAVAEVGGQSVEWHQVKALPGYIQTGIRMVGRAVFGSYTKTAIEDIQVLSSLVNPENDVKEMMNWIRKNGVQDHSNTLDFNKIMLGYKADTSLWTTKGYQFLLVRDFAGYYVYGWVNKAKDQIHNATKAIS